MISIIISTYRRKYLEQVRENIQKTIGVAFEIIAIENINQMGICAAYNTGGLKAKYRVLCFMHEDISFNTQNWGQRVLKHFAEDVQVGLLGVAGATYKTAAASSWFPWFDGNPHKRIAVMNISFPDVNKKMQLHYKNPNNDVRTRVAVADGVWLCCKREIWERVKFDEKLLKGFHCYDIDFCLSVNEHANVVVVYDILMEHFSAGDYNKQWADATYTFHKKWKWQLPVNFSDLNRQEIYYLENGARNVFIKLMYDYKITPIKIFAVIWGIGSFRFFNPGKFLLWNRNWLKYVSAYYREKVSEI